jgi:hypothetical protein
MRHFLFEEKAYSIKLSFKKRRAERDSARELARFLRALSGKGGKPPHAAPGRGRPRADARQKCVAKMQYSFSRAAHKAQLETYLVREGTDRDGSRAKLFGTDLEEYRGHMADKNFRIFLSPQNGSADLKALAETFIKRLELQTGYKLYWEGACHYNTAHPHAHLLINGVDKNGRDVAFPRDIVKTFMRETARNICTSQLGSRTQQDMDIERESALSSPRFTPLDGQLKGLCAGGFRVDLSGLPPGSRDRERLLARIEFLRSAGLCGWKDGAYNLSPRWEEDLKANGRYNTFLQSRSALRWAPQRSLRLYSGETGKITGRVARVYRTDGDASDSHAVLLETLDGRAFFVPLFKRPEVRGGAANAPLREGEFVSISTYESQKGRLTPVIFKAGAKALRREITQNNYTAPLARDVMRQITGRDLLTGQKLQA